MSGDGLGMMVIGIDPACKDGFLSMVGSNGGREFRIDMGWRPAIGMMISLHEVIHAAAETAGFNREQVHDEIDRIAAGLAAQMADGDDA
jgi:hypothetical protein